MTFGETPLCASLLMNDRRPLCDDAPSMPACLYSWPNSWQRVFGENAVRFCVSSNGPSRSVVQPAVVAGELPLCANFRPYDPGEVAISHSAGSSFHSATSRSASVGCVGLIDLARISR